MKTLYVIAGPTAVGKTRFAIQKARELNCEILSCDSRQFYKELNIGVARPTTIELASAPHHFIASRSILNPYNVFEYEQDALKLLESLFANNDNAIAVGGSGLYIDALCKGMAVLPDPAPGLREKLKKQLADEGIESFQRQLKQLDPTTYETIDKNNPVRLQRALEVCITTGEAYSKVLKQDRRPRAFSIKKTALTDSPENLRSRIDKRADEMIKEGLLDEVKEMLPYRDLQPLNTVGYKEFFDIVSGQEPTSLLDTRIQEFKNHTWQYAKKQMTWIRRDGEYDCIDLR